MIRSSHLCRQESADLLARGVALLLALAVQLALTLMFSQRKERALSPTEALTLIQITEQIEPSVETAEISREPVQVTERIIEPSSVSLIPVPSESSPPPHRLREFDTQAIAARAVAKIIEEENRRHLDGRKPVTIIEPTVPSIFEQPRRSLGDVEHDPASDTTTVWHNENCFTLIKPKAAAGSSFPNYRQCMFGIGKPEPRGDLFEHLREPKPLPEAKSGVPLELAYPERKSDGE